MHPKNRPTQSDVARIAGVSRATVSFVLNGTSGRMVPISDETRVRVLDAVKQLNYAPDPIAQMLASGSNRLIGVFTYEETFPLERSDFYYEFILGIERAAARFDYNVILFTRHGTNGAPRRVYSTGSNSLRLADGTIFLGAKPDQAELAQLSKEQYPFVYIGQRDVPGHEIDWVAADYRPAAYEATQHLLKLNHRFLAYVGSDTHVESNQSKIAGIRQAIAETDSASLAIFPETTLQDNWQMQRAIRESKSTAILCSNATTYDIVLAQIQDSNFSVPQSFSVLSLADANPNRYFPVNPTYVSIDRQQWGEKTVELLIGKINGLFDQPQKIRLPCKFVVGTSTIACPI
jgi:DNA-binding LacI/PurR family transcriptional regulator